MGIGSSVERAAEDCCYHKQRLQVLAPAAEHVGKPTAALASPGQCVIGEDWTETKLDSKVQLTHDVILLTFSLADESRPLGLSTCACILCKALDPYMREDVVRPYTPVSTNAMLGKFQLVIKVYEMGKMSQYLDALSPGATVEFKHIDKNVKIQYPFRRKHLTLLCGGTGLTPMIQVLHAVLGSTDDTTEVSFLYGNRSQSDIVCRDLLEDWCKASKGRLKVFHTLSAGKNDPLWKGPTGRIDGDFVRKHSAPPTEDVLIMVCGPPAMYATFCGPRDEPNVTGVLKELGYRDDQVCKF